MNARAPSHSLLGSAALAMTFAITVCSSSVRRPPDRIVVHRTSKL